MLPWNTPHGHNMIKMLKNRPYFFKGCVRLIQNWRSSQYQSSYNTPNKWNPSSSLWSCKRFIWVATVVFKMWIMSANKNPFVNFDIRGLVTIWMNMIIVIISGEFNLCLSTQRYQSGGLHIGQNFVKRFLISISLQSGHNEQMKNLINYNLSNDLYNTVFLSIKYPLENDLVCPNRTHIYWQFSFINKIVDIYWKK